MSKDLLRFPSGRTVHKVKQEAKKIKSAYLTNTDALNALAVQHGLDMPWDKAITYLNKYWNSWFGVHIYQEQPEWQIDVRYGRFDNEGDAQSFSKSFNGSLKWVGGDNPLIMIDDKTSVTYVVNNSDVKLWRTKPQSMNKIMISQDDLERVYAPISKWPELFHNEKPTFGSLAYAAEFGDDNGSEKGSVNADAPNKYGQIEKIGFRIRGEQSGGSLIQITHTHDQLNSSYYIVTLFSVDEISSIIAALSELVRFNDFIPGDDSPAPLSPMLVSKVLELCFEQIVISCEDFVYSSTEDTDIDVKVVNIFEIEDAFNPADENSSIFRKAIKDNKQNVISALGQSEWLSVDILAS
ncbi:hypothetical protein HNW13_017940 [Shewanella sp. BF02_Schw]|uniref:hypothetical protein n=1 Tax=Shewanella sp. BF02_Schw TaxID=394908 RepID=UPI00178567F3|nr:hypothetical protein [Shewanella sp. BF02_Schw]MBO1897621.1 hypothetical protein [Shewanella sp. BF02_Schw]